MDILALLDEKGIAYETKGADEISIICPNQSAHSDGVDSKPSFNINIVKEVGHCLACGYKIGEVGMTKWLIGGELDDFQMQVIATKSKLKRLSKVEGDLYIPTGEGYFIMPPGDQWNSDYRGVRKETYQILEAIHCTVGRYQNRICFPITQHGNFQGVDARTLGDDVPKYLRPSKCHAHEWLFPFDLAKKSKIKQAVLCEGIFHAINYLDKTGRPEALCYFGSNNWSEHKTLLLLELGLEQVLFWADNDKAGIKAMNQICPDLSKWLDVYYIPLDVLPEDGRDLGDFTTEEIESYMAQKVRWK